MGELTTTHNHLNLPVKVTFDNASNKFIEYLYTAIGQKVEKKVRHQDSLSYTRYSQGFQYFDDVLQFFHTPEGYVKNTPTETGAFSFDYVYNYTDHLGNVRMSYAQDPQTGALKIMEENHYYPFGLKHTNYAQMTKDILREEEQSEKSIGDRPIVMPLKNPGYNYKFNGMELQSEFGVNVYDFGARNYDPALGRWMNIDPLAEKMRRHSPYNYAFNNPIYFIDPDGMEAQANNSASAASGSKPSGPASMGFSSFDHNKTGFSVSSQVKVYGDGGTVLHGPGSQNQAGAPENGGEGSGTAQTGNTDTTASSSQSDSAGQGCGNDDCDILWDFSHKINKWKEDVKKQLERGVPVSAYSITAYLDAYENTAYSKGRMHVSITDVESVDGAMGEVLMTILPIGRLANYAGKGYNFVKAKNGFYYFEKTKKARDLPGQARSVYQKVYNENGKLIRMNKIDYKIDGRMYQSKPKYPDFLDSRRLN